MKNNDDVNVVRFKTSNERLIQDLRKIYANQFIRIAADMHNRGQQLIGCAGFEINETGASPSLEPASYDNNHLIELISFAMFDALSGIIQATEKSRTEEEANAIIWVLADRYIDIEDVVKKIHEQ